jgi:hypothetical protein
MGDSFKIGGGTQWYPAAGQDQGLGQRQYHHQYLHDQQTQAQTPSSLPAPSPMTNNQSTPSSPYRIAMDQISQSQSQSQSQPTNTGGSNSWGTMSEDTIPKIVELRRLLNRNPTIFTNPDMIVQGAKHFAMQGDNSFLEEKLAYLRNVDAIRGSQQQQHQPGQDNFVV